MSKSTKPTVGKTIDDKISELKSEVSTLRVRLGDAQDNVVKNVIAIRHLTTELDKVKKLCSENKGCSHTITTQDSSNYRVREVSIGEDRSSVLIEYKPNDQFVLPFNELDKIEKSFDLTNADVKVKADFKLSKSTMREVLAILKQYGYKYDTQKNRFSYMYDKDIPHASVQDLIKNIIDEGGVIFKEELEFDFKSSPLPLIQYMLEQADNYDVNGERVYLDPYGGAGEVVRDLLSRKISGNNIYALDVHPHLANSLKSELPNGHGELVDFIHFSKTSYDKAGINTVLMFPPFSVWDKAILHCKEIMGDGDVLVAVIPYAITDKLLKYEQLGDGYTHTYKAAFDFICNGIMKQTISIADETHFFPNNPMYHKVGIISYKKVLK